MSYVEAFSSVDRPKETLEAIQARFRKAKLLNDELAEYFHERALVEDQYVRNLQKLAKRTLISDKSALGNLTDVWDALFGELAHLINIHASLVKKIGEEVEIPIRSKALSPEWTELKQVESMLMNIVKDWEQRSQRMNKHKKKVTGKKTHTTDNKKLEDARLALDETTAQWISQTTEALQKYELVDKIRLSNLKESIARFETLQVETCQSREQMADRTLKLVFAYDVPADIERFCTGKSILPSGSQDDGNVTHQRVNTFKTALGSIGTIRRKRPSNANVGEPYSKFGEHNGYPKSDNEDNQIPPVVIEPQQTDNHPDESGPSSSSQVPQVIVDGSQPQVDAEGYSIPPPDVKPWDQLSNKSADENDSDARSDAASSISPERMRVEIKRDAIPENNEDTETAFKRVQSTLQSQRSVPNLNRRQLRVRRERQSSMMESMYPDGGSLTPTFDQSNSPASSSPTGSVEFSESYRKRSISGSSEALSPGLRAMISETVNIQCQGTEVGKIQLHGEVSVIYSPPAGRENISPAKLRVANYEIFEKSVPNASYLSPTSENGEYELNLQLLSLSAGKPVVILKYQVLIDPENKQLFVPFHVMSQWKCEPNLTLLVISYKANSESRLSGKLDFSLMVQIDGEVDAVQSRPSGTWSTERKKMLWQVEGFDLATDVRHRLLGRFETKEASHPAQAAVRFVCKGQLLSGLVVEVVPPTSDGQDAIAGFEDIRTVLTGRLWAAP